MRRLWEYSVMIFKDHIRRQKQELVIYFCESSDRNRSLFLNRDVVWECLLERSEKERWIWHHFLEDITPFYGTGERNWERTDTGRISGRI